VRIITEYAWHSLFSRDLFIDDADDCGRELHNRSSP